MCFNSIHQDSQCSNFGNGLRTTLHVELALDIEDVFFHQPIGDLSVGCAIHEQPRHLTLMDGQ